MATTKITSATTIDVSALLKDKAGVALTGSKLQSALTKIANFEAAVEANRSASLTVGSTKFSYTKLATSGTTGPAIQLTNGTSTFASATTLAAGTSVTPTPAPTSAPTSAPTTAPTATTYSLTANKSVVTEGTSATFTVTRTGSTTSAVTLVYNIAGDDNGGTVTKATPGTDTNVASGTVTIAAGATTGTFTVSATSDTSAEGLEGIKVSLFNDTTVVASKSLLINDDPNAPVAGQTFTLTTGTDNGSKFTGGSGDDVYTGFVDAGNASVTTLTAGDSLDGGAGNDTFQATITGTAGTTSVTGVTFKGIERIQIQNTSSAGQTIDLGLSSGYSTLSTYGSSAAVTFSNVSVAAAAEMASGSSSLTLGLASALTSGSADAISLTVTNQTGGTFTTGAGIETVNITSSGASANTVTLGNDGHTKVTVAGAQKLTLALGDTGNTITTVDASTSTGGVVLSGVGTATTSIVGGSGNDSVTIAASQVLSTVTIDGGTGTNTLVLDGSVSKTNAAKVANFGTVSFVNAAALGAIAQDASAFAASTLSVGNVNNQNFTISNLGASQAVAVTAANSGTISTDLQTNTTADTTSVTLGGSTAAAGTIAALTVSNAETVNLTSQGGANTVTTLTAGAATKLNITASKALTITTLTASALKTVDASASSAAVTFTAGSAMSVTGGSGNDAITGSSGNDSINGGEGNNTIIGGGGNDTLIGGSGNDSIRGGAGNDVITTGDGTNTVDLSTAVGGSDSVLGGAGNDTVKVTFAALATGGADTIDGGAGTNTLEFTDNATMNFTSDPTTLTNVKNIQQFKFSGISSKTVSISDSTLAVAGSSLTLVDSADNASNVFDASGVFGSSSKVTVDASALATNGVEFKIGNGADSFKGGAGTDTVTVTNNAFLSSADSIAGGSGGDTLKFSSTTGSTITASQLTNVTSMETFTVNSGGAGGNYVFTLTDAIVGSNATSTGGFSLTRNATDSGTLKVDASAVSSAYSLTLSGGAGKDTLIGGAGNDSITGGDGVNSLTGGAGNDTFVFAGTENGVSVITDMDFGTSTTAVDKIKFVVTAVGSTAAVGLQSAGAVTQNNQVRVLDSQTYANAAAAVAAADGISTGDTANDTYLILWGDSFGTIHLSVGTEVAAAENDDTVVDVATLTGVTMSSLVSKINIGDFILA